MGFSNLSEYEWKRNKLWGDINVPMSAGETLHKHQDNKHMLSEDNDNNSSWMVSSHHPLAAAAGSQAMQGNRGAMLPLIERTSQLSSTLSN